ncbi:MAG: BACON domain-containing carbohydrate-binding protein [Bryobacteraceae bacterium]
MALRYSLLLCLICASAPGQDNKLQFRPIAAEYSPGLDRIVFVAESPNQLLIYHPGTNTSTTVNLPQAPLSLAVSPNGLFAAIGHANAISYVNLSTAAVDRSFPLPGPGGLYTLALGSEWLYVLTRNQTIHYSIRLSDGQVTPGAVFGSLVGGLRGRLNPAQTAIYHTEEGSGRLTRFDTSTGPITESVTGYEVFPCGGIWYSPDGSRIYNGCGFASQHAPNLPGEMGYLGTLDNVNRIKTLAESAAPGLVALVNNPQVLDNPDTDSMVRLFDAKTYRETGQLPLPSWSGNGGAYLPHGRWVFFNNAGTALYAVHQADGASGLLNDFAVQVTDLANQTPCGATFGQSAITVPSSGILRTVPISAPSPCVHRATTSTPWLQVIAGGFGAGNGTLRIHAHSNPAQTARTGLITMGNQTLTVTQDAASSTPVTVRQLSYQLVDAEYSRQLDRLVTVSTQPDELHIFQPSTGERVSVPLDRRPTAISVRPDGVFAAVAHNGAVSLVNLQTAKVERVYTGIRDAVDVVLTAEGFIYAMSAGQELFPINTASGSVSKVSSRGTRLRLHPAGKFLYTASSTSNLSRADIRQQPPTTSSVSRVNNSCGDVWMSDSGTRYYTACGGVYRYSELASEDGQDGGALVIDGSAYVSIANSSARGLTAALGGGTQNSGSVQLYRDDGLALLGRLSLSTYTDGATNYPVTGRLVFWNSDATRLVVVSQISATAGVLSDSMVDVVSPESVAGCAITLSNPSINISGAAMTGQVSVNAGSNCAWSALSNAPWIHITPNPITSSGTGAVPFSVQRNQSATPRTGTISINTLTFTIQQGAVPTVAIEPKQITIPANTTGGVGVGVFTSGPLVSWTATSSAAWLPITDGASGTGDRPVSMNYGPNTGPARTAIITVTSGAFSDTATITQEAGASTAGMRFVPVPPCRVVDTRGEPGLTAAFGPPVLAGGNQRSFPIPQGRCNIPGNATAYSLNVTVVPRGGLSYITLWPTGQPQPLVSTLNSFDGRIKANAAIVPAGTGGAVSAFVTDTTDVILDINGYFVPLDGTNFASTSALRTIVPCRVVDTRSAVGKNGGPSLNAGQTRSFLLRGSLPGCEFIPNDVVAYSVNITAIPKSGSLAYLSAWPTGLPQPVVSTLNAFTGTVVANAAIVPVGTGGEISIFVTDAADVVIDLNGYFQREGLSYYPLPPCRVLDTRNPNGTYGGPVLNAGSSRTFSATGSGCGIPSVAQAFSMNATVVPSAGLSYLTIWPAGAPQPFVSTLNAFDGSVTSNALSIRAGTGGSFSTFVTDTTHLIIDTSGYFAP